MRATQAIPTVTAITRRTSAALSCTPAESRLVVPAQAGHLEPGQRGHLQHTLVSAIRTLHYSRRTEQAYWHWTRAFVLCERKWQTPLHYGASRQNTPMAGVV